MAISTLESVLIAALAGWRIAFFIVYESGPFALMEKARARVKLGGLTSCFYCASVWSAGIAWVLLGTILAPLVYMAAAAGLALMLHRFVGFDHS